jgi:hypothetical protein
MRGFRPLLLTLVLLILAAVYAYGVEETTNQGRLARHLLGAAVQIVAPLLAGIGCLAARRAYAPGDRERAVWSTGALAALAWAVGRAIFAGYQWWGGRALPYPSIADGFFVVFYVLLGLALGLEIKLVAPMVDRPIRLVLLGVGIAGCALGFVYIVGPIMASSASLPVKALATFYPTIAVILVPAGLLPAVGFRGGTSAYTWLAVAAAAVCLAVASLGYAFLTWYELYSDVHTINALWVAGFVFLALGGFWQRTVQEEI